MNDQTASLRASIDNSGTKSQLVINGTIMVYAQDFDIEVEKAEPEGFSPSICLVLVTVRERLSPMKGMMQPFHLKIPYSNDRWQSVQVTFQYDPEEGSKDRVQDVSAYIEGV